MGRRRALDPLSGLPNDFSFGQFVLILSLMTVGAVGALLWSGYQFWRDEFPNVAALKTRFPVVEYRGRDKPFSIRVQKTKPPGWTTLPEVSRAAQGAVIVSEDWAFFSHNGYDAHQISEAVKNSWEEGRLSRGASTITQQVVKNVFLERDRTLWRKLKELWLAVRLEDAIGKRKILEVYFNIAEWGEGIFGIHAAARHYFGKRPSELGPKEGAFLAMLLPSPKRYSQSFRDRALSRYARSTINNILRKMERARYLSEEERDRELTRALSFETAPDADPVSSASEPEPEPEFISN